jgi:hypothetical protein
LVIPENPTDLSFLQGCWYSDSHLVSRRTGLPIKDKYCFDGQGRGNLTTEEMDGSGRVTGVCRATATAKFRGKQLVFTDSGAKCPSGSSYLPYDVVCTPDERGRAKCRGTSGSNSYNVDITRVK